MSNNNTVKYKNDKYSLNGSYNLKDKKKPASYSKGEYSTSINNVKSKVIKNK